MRKYQSWWVRCLCLLVVAVMMIPAAGCAKQDITIVMPENMTIMEEDVCLEDGTLVVNNQLLLVADPDVSYKKVEKLVRSAGGEIIGYISFSGDYQIEFPNGKSYEQLQEIIGCWKKENFVKSVSVNQVFRAENESLDYSNDPWEITDGLGSILAQDTEWDEEKPSGTNWWAEAIKMPSVWNMDIWNGGDTEKVKVGVIDSVFAEQHKDLDDVLVKTWENNNFDGLGKKDKNHGTHVAGIIGAEMGNGVGIAGVASCAKPDLYGFAMMGEETEVYTGTMHWKYALASMFSEGVKVINISMGPEGSITIAAQRGNKEAQKDIAQFDSEMSAFLESALNAGYDFLIVKSAGNTSGEEYVECEVTKETPYGYREAEPGEIFGVIKEDCSAKYAWLAGITNAEVRKHIIAVGAAEMDYGLKGKVKYSPTDFSNYDCDLYAPGMDILSIFYGSEETDTMPGTSQAAPIVSGVATLIWSVNPNLTGEQVRDIVMMSSVLPKSDITAKNVTVPNAAFAVNLAKSISGDSGKQKETFSKMMGCVYTERIENNEIKKYSVPNLTMLIYKEGVEYQRVEMGENYTFEYDLPKGTYSVSFAAEGFVKYTAVFELQENDVEYLSVCLKPEEELPETEDEEEIALYEDILNMFYTNLTTGWIAWDGENWEDVYDPDNVSIVYMLDPEEFDINNVGFELRDLDGNGIQELIIGTRNRASEGMIYELYTVHNDRIVHLISAGERSWYYLATDGSVNHFGSMGAASSLNVNYRLDTDKGTLDVGQAILCDGIEHEDNPWFYTEEDFVDKQTFVIDFDAMKNIPESEARMRIEQFPENAALTLIPFSEYESSAPEKPEIADSDGTLREEYRQILAEHVETREQGYLTSGDYADYEYDLAYTVYDINKDGMCELIVREDLYMYYIYSRYEDTVCLLDDEFWNYCDCLYEYDGNGIIVHDGGRGYLHLEYVWLYSIDGANFVFTDTLVNSEEVPLEEVYSFLEKQTPINNFCDVEDLSLLLAKV